MVIYGVVPEQGMFPGVSAVFEHGQLNDFMHPIYLHELGRVGKDDILIYGAWHPSYAVEVRRSRGRTQGLLWTSPLLQAEFSGVELSYITTVRRLLEKKVLDFVWCGSPGMTDVFGKNAFYAPYPVHVWEAKEVDPVDGHASLYGPQHPRKNMAAQVVAARESGVVKFLHLNGGNRHLLELAQAVGLTTITTGWLPREDYFRSIAMMQVGLQASVPGVESFNYVTWDHLCQGTPIVHTVPWGPASMRVSDPADPDELRKAIMRSSVNVSRPGVRSFAEQVAPRFNRWFRSAFDEAMER